MTANKKRAAVVIDLADVRKAGGVREAIAKACEESDTVSCGVVGPEFSTSGPGPGWSTTHGADEFALRAFQGGATVYLDLDDGRTCEAIPVDEHAGETPEDTHYTDADGNEYTPDEVTYDGSGGYVLLRCDWSDGSGVYVECPDEEDALTHPAEVADMARAVIEHHHTLSPVGEWRELLAKMKAAAEVFDGIDADDLPAE